jgi:hypothetical protein
MTTKVLVETRDRDVSVQVLAEVDGSPAVSERGFFFALGTVWETTIPSEKPAQTDKKVWQWRCDSYSGTAPTKAKAITAMLDDCDYEQVSLTATISDLLAGL